MSIERTDSQQTTCNATTLINGERRQVASATCTLRAGKSLMFSVDLLDGGPELTADDRRDIADMFGNYLVSELEKAAGLGIPIAL